MNIKRLILIWVMILCLLSAASYADSAASKSLSSPYYQITESNVAETGASWAVISHNGNIIAEGTALPYCDVPMLICIEGDIPCLRDGGGNAFWFTFYDVAQERISKDYEYVIDLRGETVLYSDLTDGGWRIALANIFSGDILHSVPIDLCTAEGWVQNAEWDEASKSWIITYLAGAEYEETRLVFPANANSNATLCPIRENGLWSCIDEQAQWVIPPQYDSADSFRDGFALAEKDGKLMYIDHSDAVL